MKKTLLSLATLSLILWTTDAHAAPTVQHLMKEHGCYSCHGMSEKKFGPSLEKISRRYHRKKGSLKMLALKVINGGSGNWTAETGGKAQPPYPNLTLHESEQIVRWILSLK